MEFGTKNYPFRTLNPVFAEILKQHSHTNREINVYVKEGTVMYIQDANVQIVNMKLITINTYSNTSIPGGMATIYSIDTPQEYLSTKAAFHIIKNITVDLATIISGGSFTTSELSVIGKTGAAFEVIQTSITVNNIIAKRIASSTSSGVFLYLIYLQTKTMTLSKFYI